VPEVRPEPAPLEQRHAVCQRLLARLPLDLAHRQALLQRGFSEPEMEARGYGVLRNGPGRARLCREIHAGDMQSLAGVPGFYTKLGDDGRPYWSLAGRCGLLIPCRDPKGRIRGLRLRPDDSGGGGKYRWLSSAGRPGGTGSGVHCHVARPLSCKVANTVWVTEGEVKADIAAERLGAVVISVPGVDCWPSALPDLEELLPGGGTVVLALDADWPEKPSVGSALWHLALACRALAYGTEVATWNVKYKGLDDLLAAGLEPQRLNPSAIPAPRWETKASSRIAAELPANPTQTMTLAEMRLRLPGVFDQAFRRCS
jgi:hypothetical protein